MHVARCCLLACTLLPSLTFALQRIEPAAVPEPLRPWTDWVLAQHPDRDCPFLHNSADPRRCAWPGRLHLELSGKGGRFEASWEVFADSWITLPGDRETWPQDVRIDGSAAVVVERTQRPAVRVGAGTRRIEGRFTWERVPESLSVPEDTALVSLSVDGDEARQGEVDRGGRLWLRPHPGGLGRADAANENRLGLTVLRRIVDDNPMELYTRLEFDVTGAQREQRVGAPLPPGFIPVELAGALPARLDRDGLLTVQLRPGRHTVTVRGRHPDPVFEIRNAPQPEPWPEAETWVFEARNDIRVVDVRGVASVDPRQTRVPEDWRHLPAFALTAGDVMVLNVTRRGDPDPQPDKLDLRRELWLDFDGGAYTTHDVISGQITRGWRLDSGPELDLGQVVIDGQPQFITRLGDGENEGVEVRRGTVDLRADGRMPGAVGRFAASGWAHGFHSVAATLRLPPGWDVFSIRGVDNVPDTWVTRWTMLDLFMVLVISAAVLHLWHWQGAAIALAATVLTWHAPDAPRFVWIHLLAATALLRVLPAGRFRFTAGLYRNVAALVLILIAIPFVVHELRLAVYPQLAGPQAAFAQFPGGESGTAVTQDEAADAMIERPAVAAETLADMPASAAASVRALKQLAAGGEVRSEPKAMDLYAIDPDALVQTGPGLPTWRWREVHLAWNGPVEPQQLLTIRFLPPPANAAMHVARVALLLALMAVVAGLGGAWLRNATRRAGAAAMVVLGLGAFGGASPAQAAGFPQPAMLEELERRLLAPPECGNQCADIARMHVDVGENTLLIHLEVHAAEATAIPVPGNARAWLPQTVLLDDGPAVGLARDAEGSLWLQVRAGVHHVLLQGALEARDRVQIAVPLRPRFTEVTSVDAWTVEGLREKGLVEAQLQLSRTRAHEDTPPAENFSKARLPPFVRVERTVGLDLDWTVTTRVVRVAGGDQAVVLSVPLLAGESVVTAGIEVADGAVQVNLPRDQQATAWQSVLAKTDAITLVAPATPDWSETWRLRAGPIWHATLAGIAPVQYQGHGDRWLPEWRPWPGESITIHVSRPVGIGGQTLTIDSSVLHLQPGRRATDASLDLRLRSSKGGQYTMRLPAGAALQQVRIDGAPQPIRADGDTLTLPVTPGTQQISIAWRHDAGVSNRLRTPAIDLGLASINHEIRLVLGSDRWTLLTFGPRLGPAVLFWSLLAALLIAATALSRVPLTPLRTHEWLLLALGLSQLFLPLGAIVVLWLFALGLRERAVTRVSGARFNLMQIGLALLTIAAMLVFIEAIRRGLLGHPDMHVAGNGSHAHALNWYADRVGPVPPSATAVSVPMLVYRALMLAWALWLAAAVVRWLRWGWSCFARDGLWQSWTWRRAAAPGPAAPSS